MNLELLFLFLYSFLSMSFCSCNKTKVLHWLNLDFNCQIVTDFNLGNLVPNLRMFYCIFRGQGKIEKLLLRLSKENLLIVSLCWEKSLLTFPFRLEKYQLYLSVFTFWNQNHLLFQTHLEFSEINSNNGYVPSRNIFHLTGKSIFIKTSPLEWIPNNANKRVTCKDRQHVFVNIFLW